MTREQVIKEVTTDFDIRKNTIIFGETKSCKTGVLNEISSAYLSDAKVHLVEKNFSDTLRCEGMFIYEMPDGFRVLMIDYLTLTYINMRIFKDILPTLKADSVLITVNISREYSSITLVDYLFRLQNIPFLIDSNKILVTKDRDGYGYATFSLEEKSTL